MNVEEYEERLRQRVGEAEYGRHKELVRLLARNLTLEDIHTEFRALNIEVPTVAEERTTDFAEFLGDLGSDDGQDTTGVGKSKTSEES